MLAKEKKKKLELNEEMKEKKEKKQKRNQIEMLLILKQVQKFLLRERVRVDSQQEKL